MTWGIVLKDYYLLSLNLRKVFMHREMKFELFIAPLIEVQRQGYPCFISAQMRSLDRYQTSWEVLSTNDFLRLTKTHNRTYTY